MKKIKMENAEGQSVAQVTKPNHCESHSFKKKKRKNKLKIQDSEVSATTADTKEVSPLKLLPDDIKSENTKYLEDIKSSFSPLWLQYKPRSTTLIKIGVNWYEQLIAEPEGTPVDPLTKKELKRIAEKILQQDVDNYKKMEERNAKKQDLTFRKTLYTAGTFRDKLAAYVLRCMESPPHSLHHLNSIILMISPKAKDEFEEALDSVLQLLSSTLLPQKRVARKFEEHKFSCLLPLLASNREQAEKQIALWYFEDQLQFAYRKLISQLKLVSGNTVDKTKMVGIKNMTNLVKKHPGQNVEMVLEAIVNKLGDPSRKVAAQAMHYLLRLLEYLPSLKNSVVTIVEILLYRPNITVKTQYYCLCYLKDIIFNRSDYQLAVKLIKLYIGFFKACTKKGEVDTRMMGALLRGINRAFPYSRLHGDALQEQLDVLYKLCHIVSFSVVTQALQLIYQVITSKDHVEDRFYQIMYGQIQNASFGTSSGNTAFLNLVFKAMMRDDSIERRQAFIKRLLQVAQYQSPHMMCGILFLVSEIMKEKADMRAAIQTVLKTHVDCDDPGDDFEKFEDAEDIDAMDIKGADGEFEDVKEESDDSNESFLVNAGDYSKSLKPLDVHMKAPSVSSWFHRANTNLVTMIKRNYYDPYLRNPQYCGAHYSPLWELLFLQEHYHPSVSMFTDKIAGGGVIDYAGDPLQDFTLIRFLDRFVYKNPKKDIENPNLSTAILGRRAYYRPQGARGIAVNSEEFLNLASDEVPEDQQFFHSYFTKFKQEAKKKKDDDENSIADDEFDEYLDKIGAAKDDSDIDEDLDFAAGTSAVTTNVTKGDNMDMESDEDHYSSGEEEPVFGGHDDSGDDAGSGGIEDLDEENVAFSDDDDDFDSSPTKKGKSKQPPKKRSKQESLSSMFASADDFAHLLEENADEDTGIPSTTSKALSNKDRAHAKQLNWEVDRDDRLQGRGRYGNRGSWKRGQSKPFRGRGNFKSSAGGAKGNFRSARGRGSFKKGGPKGNFKNDRGRGSFKSKRGRRK